MVALSRIKRTLENRNQTDDNVFIYMCRPYQDSSLIFEVRLGDVMDLVCPFYDEQQSFTTNEYEQYDIYRVCYRLLVFVNLYFCFL